jgi:predicted RNA binding protein YcfA (HicA-like mRNA interferase family)
MPMKVRELKAALAKAGFVKRPAKGSHLHWVHPDVPGTDVTIAGHDGDDAQYYQIKQVKTALKKAGGTL